MYFAHTGDQDLFKKTIKELESMVAGLQTYNDINEVQNELDL